MAAKMTIRVILKSGAEFTIKCDEVRLTRNGLGSVTGYDIKGITENKPVYLNFEEVAAVVRTYSDEQPEQGATPSDPAYVEKSTNCPFCGGDNKNATIFEDKENKEFFVYCKKCGIETEKTYKTAARAIAAFTEGKNRKISGSEVAEDEN